MTCKTTTEWFYHDFLTLLIQFKHRIKLNRFKKLQDQIEFKKKLEDQVRHKKYKYKLEEQ